MVHAEARLFGSRGSSMGDSCAPGIRRRTAVSAGKPLRDHRPKPHSSRRPSRVRRLRDASASGRQPRARAPACYPTSAHGALRIAHTRMHTCTHTHTCTCACACACACAHVHVRMRVRVRVLASRRASGERAQAHLRVEKGLTAASQVAFCVRAQERPRLQPRALPRQGTRRQRLRAASGRRGARGALESRAQGHSGSSHSSWR